jgi:serine protease Do
MKKRSNIIMLLLILFVMSNYVSPVGSEAVMASANMSGVSMKDETQSEKLAQGRALADQLSLVFEGASKKVSASVVPVFSEEKVAVTGFSGFPDDPLRDFFGDDFFKQFFGEPQKKGEKPQERKQIVHGLGSGVIVSPDGIILTNNHVVDGAEKLTVVLSDKKKYTAKVIGTDPQTDLAVIKIDATNLPAAILGNSDAVRIGQWVIAVGNPFQLLHTVTAGIISAVGRSSVGLADYEDFIQTDASINPGNSGGALADLDGNVIGINTAISSPSGGNVGIGFAIPINMARNVMNELLEKGKISRGYLGVILQDIDENLSKAMNIKTMEGALVGDVISGGPADKAGIKTGDVIIKLDGQQVTNSTDIRNRVAQMTPKSEAKITVLRDGKEIELNVVLGERPNTRKEAKKSEQEQNPDEQTNSKLGLSIQNLTPDAAQQLGYENETGVVVTEVESGSPADDAGLRSGDLIKVINKKTVTTVKEFIKAAGSLKSGDIVSMLVRRDQNTFFLAIQIP